MNVNGCLREVRSGSIKFLDPLYETQFYTAWGLLMSVAFLTSRASLPPIWEASSRTIRKLQLALVSEARGLGSFLASNAFPVGSITSSPYSMIQLEYFACLLDCEFEELGGRLEQIPYAYAILITRLLSGGVL